MPELKYTTIDGRDVIVDYSYSYDPGKHTLDNGDPGYPPTEEIDINEITDAETEEDLTKKLSEDDERIIYEKISEQEH